MKLYRPYLFIVLSLSITSTTNTDPTNAEVLEWKGGDGVKRSRVRRQNIHLPNALRLQEKAYALYVLWRLLNEVSNNTNTIRTSTMRPDKLESMTSERPKNTEIVFKAKDKPSSAPTQEQSTQSTGITGTNNSTAMGSFPTDPSSPDSKKTTQSGDLRLVKQSTQRFETTIQQIPEASQVTDQHKPDSTTFKNVEEPSLDIMHEESTPSTGTNDSTAITSFPTELPPQASQKNTQSGAPRFTQQSTQHIQSSKQKISEPSQVTDQHIPDSTTLTFKISSKAAEELSSTIIHERIDHFTRITDTSVSTAMAYFPTHSPDSQKTTQSGDSLLVEQSTMAKEKMTEPSRVTEPHISHSEAFKISSKAVEEPSSDIMLKESTRSKGTNDSTAITSFPTELPPQESQKNTQSGAPLFTQQSTQHIQRSKEDISEPSQVTYQHISDSTTLTFKISSKAAEELSSTIIHEQIDHFTRITDTSVSTAMAYFPTHSPDSQKTTQSGDSLLVEQSNMAKGKMTEPIQVTEPHISHSETLQISSKAVEEPSSDIMHKESTRSKGTNDSTAITSFPTELPPLFIQQSTRHIQRSKEDISEPSQVTDQHISDSTTLTIKTSSNAAEELSSTIIHERIDHFTGITDTSVSTAMAYFPTHSPDSQKTTQSGDSLLVEQSTMAKGKMTEPIQVTEPHISHSETLQISSKAVEELSSDTMHKESTRSKGTNDSTAITSFPTELPPQESQKNTQPGAPLFTQQSTQHIQRSKEDILEPSQVTEKHIPDSTTLIIKISSKAVNEPSSTLIHERIDHFTGITNTKGSTAMAYFPTHSLDLQKTTQSGDSLLVEQSTMANQKMTEPSQVTKQHISHSKTSTFSLEAVEEHSSDIMHEESTRSKGTNDSTAITSFPTELPPQESQKNTQPGAPLFTQQSTQHIQCSKEDISEPSQITEKHIPDSTTLIIKISSKAVNEPSSTLIHERIDHFTGITDTKVSRAIKYFPTHSLDLQKTTQSRDSLLVEQSTMAKQKMTEPSQVREQHISHSKTSKMSLEAVEEPSSDIMHEERTSNNSTAITSFPVELPPQESQKNTQSGAPLFTQQSTRHIQRSKEDISEPSQVTDQNISDSTTLTIKITHERFDNFTGITDTSVSTAMAYFPTHSPDSQKTTQSGDSLLVEQSTMAKGKRTEPIQVTEPHISHSETLQISSKAVEEPSSDIMHKESTRSKGTNDSTAITSFPTELPPQERFDNFTGITAMASFPTHSHKTTQSGESQLVEQSKKKITEPSQVTEQHIPHSKTFTIKIPSKAVEKHSLPTIHDQIAHFTGMTGTTDSTSQEIVQSTALTSIPVIATAYRNEKETLLQTAINSHISNHGIPASTRGNNSLQPTSLPQTMTHEHPRTDITGMVKGISKSTLPARTKNPTLSSSAVKLEILETATYTHSVTWHNGNPNQFVMATDRRDPKSMPTAITMKQQIQDSTSLLPTEESPISHFNGFTLDSERHKPIPPEEPTNQHTEQNTNNTAKSSRDSLMQHFMTTKTHVLTNASSVSRKTASTSPLPSLTEARLVDSKGPGGTSVLTGISLHVSTSSAAPFRTYQMNPKTQSRSTTNKYPIHGTIMPHTSALLVKDTSTQALTDRVQLSQTIPVSTEKLTVTFASNQKPSEKDTHTTSVARHGPLTLRTQEIPFWISTKRSNLNPIETTEPQSHLTNQEPTADTVVKENDTNNDLLTEIDKPTQSTIGRILSKTTRTATTRLSKTQKVSQNPKKLHKSSDTAIKDDMQTGRGIFGLLFSLGCLILLIIIILFWVVWRRWQSWHWSNDIWVAGPPLMCGTYHSVLQSSSPHTAIAMTKWNTQKNKQENHDVDESIALKQQQKDLH